MDSQIIAAAIAVVGTLGGGLVDAGQFVGGLYTHRASGKFVGREDNWPRGSDRLGVSAACSGGEGTNVRRRDDE